MFFNQFYLLITILSILIRQSSTRTANAFAKQNKYDDYRLYSVQMPNDYDLRPDSLVSKDDQLNDENSNASARNLKDDSNNLFYSLINQLINHAPIDLWQLEVNNSVFLVSPDYYVQVEDYLLNNSLSFKLLEENIQDRLNREWSDMNDVNRIQDVFNANQLKTLSKFSLDVYHPLDEINEYLRYLAKRYPDTVRTNSIGKTFENRDILAVTIRRKSNLKRPNILIDAGIHPREWITQASALVLITKLVFYFNMNASHTVLDSLAFYHNQTEADLVVPIDWTIIPVLNPDGYQYTWSQDRLYRKNRAVPKASPRRAPWNLFKECIGTDLNRNFEYYFAHSAQSTNPCNDIFAGDEAFSEKESSALRTHILSNRPQAYISLHSFSQLISFPNKINRGRLPNHDQLKDVARRMSSEMKELEGKSYRYGQISQFHYGMIGDSVGWTNLNGVNLTFRIDLRDKGALGYMIPRNQIVSSGEEVLKGAIVVADEVKRSFKSY